MSEARKYSDSGRNSSKALQNSDEEVTLFPEPATQSSNHWNMANGFRDWDPRYQLIIDTYLDDITKALGNASSGGMRITFDLYNEPQLNFKTLLQEKNVKLFIARTYHYVRSNAPRAPCTVGWAGASALNLQHDNDLFSNYGVRQDYLSFHEYDLVRFRLSCQARKAQAASYRGGNVPVVCSEFWQARDRGRLANYLWLLAEEEVGGQMWGFIQANSWSQLTNAPSCDWDGVVAPPPARTSVFRGRSLAGFFKVLNQPDLIAASWWHMMAKSK
jgi:hypothetical protein